MSNKLDAVNEMLEAAGIPPVSALDTGGDSEEGNAESTLDRIDERIQGEGWAQNTVEKEYDPDGSKNITIASDVLRIEPAGKSSHRRLSNRDGTLYDLEDDTDEFDESVVLDVVEKLTFDQMTPKLRTYITKAAAVKFQREIKGGQVDDSFARQELREAKGEARQEDIDLWGSEANVLNNDEINILKGTPRLRPQRRRY